MLQLIRVNTFDREVYFEGNYKSYKEAKQAILDLSFEFAGDDDFVPKLKKIRKNVYHEKNFDMDHI